MWLFVTLILIFSIWMILHLKTSRSDGVLRTDVHPYRRMLAFIMPRRNDSVVYFDITVRAEQLIEYLAIAREQFNANMTHCLVAAVNKGLAENPALNQFVIGKRLYRRQGRWITFSMKRKKLDREAKLSAVKLPMKDDESFKELCERINKEITHERSGEETYSDREYSLLNRLPRPVLGFGVWALQTLDYFNLLPQSFIANDGMYTSVFVANLGSLNMAPGFHHLYEWGNCPMFIVAGAVEELPVIRDGELGAAKILRLRCSYDERVDDGLTARAGIESLTRILEDPFAELGCVEEDGSDSGPMLMSAEN